MFVNHWEDQCLKCNRRFTTSICERSWPKLTTTSSKRCSTKTILRSVTCSKCAMRKDLLLSTCLSSSGSKVSETRVSVLLSSGTLARIVRYHCRIRDLQRNWRRLWLGLMNSTSTVWISPSLCYTWWIASAAWWRASYQSTSSRSWRFTWSSGRKRARESRPVSRMSCALRNLLRLLRSTTIKLSSHWSIPLRSSTVSDWSYSSSIHMRRKCISTGGILSKRWN